MPAAHPRGDERAGGGLLGAERWGWPGALIGLIVGFVGIFSALYVIAMTAVLIERG